MTEGRPYHLYQRNDNFVENEDRKCYNLER